MKRRRIYLAAVMAAAAITALAPAATAAVNPVPAISNPHVLVHLNLAAGQTPENIAPGPRGAIDVTFAEARTVDQISAGGKITLIATLPKPPKGITSPLGYPLTAGLQRLGSTLYVDYDSGYQATNGLWQIAPGQRPVLVAALPVTAVANGLTYSAATSSFYISDSQNGVIYRVPRNGGTAQVFLKVPELRRTKAKGFGVNGVRAHSGALYADNHDLGLLMRISLEGPCPQVQVIARNLSGIDDFNFVPGTDQVLAAINDYSELDVVYPNGGHRVLLTSKDGLSNPTSVLIRQNTVYVNSAAYTTMKDPNVLVGHLGG